MARSVLVTALMLLFVLSSSEDVQHRLNMSSHWDRGPPHIDKNFIRDQNPARTTSVVKSVFSDFNLNNINNSLALERRLEMSTEFFFVPTTSTTTSTSSNHVTKTKCVGCTQESSALVGLFRNEVWVIPVIALSVLTMFLIVGFEIFVLCKACQTIPSRRHLFLGQMLLLGLFTGAGLGSVIAMTPTPATCAIIRFSTGVSYAIVFAALLVKSVFLISLNSGVYLPAPYQGLLLLFAVLIQVAIGTQWLITNPPGINSIPMEKSVGQTKHPLLVTAEEFRIPICQTAYTEMLFSLVYIFFLILFVSVLAFKSRSIRDNYREATYIGLSIGCSIPTWLVWILSGFIVNDRHKDACLAFGLVISSAMVFLIMFMPKGRQLAAMGKEGLYMEDREDRFSSLSRTGSGYSPSFFHFKPMKYAAEQNKRHHTVTTIGNGKLYPKNCETSAWYAQFTIIQII